MYFIIDLLKSRMLEGPRAGAMELVCLSEPQVGHGPAKELRLRELSSWPRLYTEGHSRAGLTRSLS